MKYRMVNDIPLATIYSGMSLARFNKLAEMEHDAYVKAAEVYAEEHGDNRFFFDIDFDEQEKLIDVQFRILCDRAASKAGWHAAKRAISNTKNRIKKGSK